MLDSAGCGQGLRSMWAPIPFHVGRHYGDVGTDSADVGTFSVGAGQQEYCPAGFGIMGLPHVPVATGSPCVSPWREAAPSSFPG